MAHQVTLTLSDDEYRAIAAAAAEAGEPIEALLHEAVARRFATRPSPAALPEPFSEDEVEAYLYRIGFTANLPTHEPDTPEEEAELDRLAQLFSQGKSLVEMIIEDRGPY
jgi:hypothetical protein